MRQQTSNHEFIKRKKSIEQLISSLLFTQFFVLPE